MRFFARTLMFSFVKTIFVDNEGKDYSLLESFRITFEWKSNLRKFVEDS